MIISIKVLARARQEKVIMQPDGSIKVWVREAPEKGRANSRVLELLADFFGKSRQDIRILKGHTSNRKLAEIN